MDQTMFVLGASGFIGSRVVQQAIASGWRVKALTRSSAGMARLSRQGAIPVRGDAGAPSAWSAELKDSRVVIDLLQPRFAARLNLRTVRRIAVERQRWTQNTLDAMKRLEETERPLLLSISGIDDLQPDTTGHVHAGSALRRIPVGFAHIGIPVRRMIEGAGVAAIFVYLGTVYGPGKGFAQTIFPRLKTGKWKVIGKGANHAPLVHVDDAARALVHVAGLVRAPESCKSFVIADPSAATARAFFDHAALLMGAAPAGSVPAWLASLIAGRPLVETMTRDVVADPSALTATGFRFRYPSYREGLPPTLEALGYMPSVGRHRPAKSRLPFWPLFAVTIGLIAAENTLHYTLSLPYMSRLSGGLPILDMRFWYSPENAYRLFDALGAKGRTAYLHLLLSVDVLIPLLAMMTLWSAISRGALRKWRAVALAGGVADYLENAMIITLLAWYPEHLNIAVGIAACLTLTKLVSYIAGITVAIVGYGLRLLRGNGSGRSAHRAGPESV